MDARVVCVPWKGPVTGGRLNYQEAPVIPPELYQARTEALLQAGSAFDALVLYADKEHFSNLEYLTGYDPRYEECLYILRPGELPRLVLGNEGMGQAQCVTAPHEKILCQLFSPMGQPRGTSSTLSEIFQSAGLGTGSKVGLLGWKGFTPLDGPDCRQMFEVPAFLADTLRALGCELENANGLLMDSASGLRAVHEPEELILAELASAKASRKVWDFIAALRPGVTELDASAHLSIDGEPCPTYPNICFRGKGILSPTPHTVLEQGSQIAFGMGYRYAQIHRVGFYVRDREELERRYPGVYDGLLSRYFLALCAWYEALALDATGGEVWEAVRAVVDDFGTFGVVLNPGHLIHTEEWMNSPFSQGGTTPLRSGMMLQCDFTARPAAFGGVGVHVEDGVILADPSARAAIQAMAPECYGRMLERQKFMRSVLGIQIRDEVLPTSDLCGMLHPFLSGPSVVLAKKQFQFP
ncbi:MAG: hypothetical protein HFF18_11465 [Oscillospiraceae bacterium]|nr:hypothetical protein [Oscillospiraceae bacterium]